MNKRITKQLEKLAALRLPELQERYAEIVGETTRTPNKRYILNRIGAALEAAAAGKKHVKASLNEPADELSRPTVIPPGDAESDPIEDPMSSPTDEPINESIDETALVENDSIRECTTSDPVEESHDEPIVETEHAECDADNDSDVSETESDTDEIAALQQLYLEVVGRPTLSRDAAYIKWKVRQAKNGKVRTGPLQKPRDSTSDSDCKVLPVRLESDLVDKIDDAWKRLGLKSRMDLFRKALTSFFALSGEKDVADLLHKSHREE